MKLKNIYKVFPVAGLVLSLGLTSCVDDLNVTPIDPNLSLEFKQDEVFTKIYATMALTGQKGPNDMGDVAGIDEGTSGFYRLIWNLNELTTDEALCAWGDPGIPELNFARWSSSHDQIKGMYYRLYFDINLTNHFLEKIEGLNDEKTVKQRAEARFIRALNYYYLLDFYGNVAFTERVSPNLPPRIERKDLFAYIESELNEIEGDMYDAKQAPYGRADKAANWLLMSRLLLNAEVYTGSPRWNDAATYSKKIIDSPYSMIDNYKYLFMGDNDGSAVNNSKDEIILPISVHYSMTRSWTTGFFLLASTHMSDMPAWGIDDGWAGNRARSSLVNKFFETGIPGNADLSDLSTLEDERAMFFAKDRTLEIENVNVFEQGFSVSKFSNLRADGEKPNDNKSPDMDVPFLRTAEAYLNYAEASMRSGNSGEALWAVNQIRERAGARTYSVVSLDDILDEKAREFYFEGHRRTDLIRYGYFGGSSAYTYDWKGGSKYGSNFRDIYNLYPIPDSDLNANHNLIQNPGY